MRRNGWLRLALYGTSTLAAVTAPRAARAQSSQDVNPVLPNVMVLLDTSGSMEMMPDGTDPDATPANKCKISLTAPSSDPTSVPNRWGSAVQALTGNVVGYDTSGNVAYGYACTTMSRGSSNPTSSALTFGGEYSINLRTPYDYNYSLPYHRPVSMDGAKACTIAPGKLPGLAIPAGAGGSVLDFPSGGLAQRDYLTGLLGCNFSQRPDGAIDNYGTVVRFGLMTFDTTTDPGTGTTGSGSSLGLLLGALTAPDPAPPFLGTWSYFPGWDSGSSANAATGRPPNCSTSQTIEVGARNPAAPPWEGRMVKFPDPNALTQPTSDNNTIVQQVITAMRPYGATPIAGMMQDAKYYYWGDPTGPQQTDAYVQGLCRQQFIILLTDGAPNLDLRPTCTNTAAGGKCPFDLPETIASQLYGSGPFPNGGGTGSDGTLTGTSVTTFVIGFAVSQVNDTTPIDCDTLAQDQATFQAKCSDTNPATQALYGPCCNLEKIALAGSGGQQRAIFVKSQQDLSNALSVLLSKTVHATARTVPAYSPQVTEIIPDPNNPVTNGSTYISSFVPTPGQLWSGDVKRTRYVCSATQALQKVTPTGGDDFAADLNSGVAGSGTGGSITYSYAKRQFATVEPALVSNKRDSSATIRPYAYTTDGFGTYGGTYVAPTDPSAVVAAITPDALNVTATSCPNQFGNRFLGDSTRYSSGPAACKALALNFAMAQATTSPDPRSVDASFATFVNRSKNAFADVFHSTPAVVGPPQALVRDDSYQAFAALPNVQNRPTTLYVSTNDGLLHAFDTSVPVASAQLNEIWAFMPPAVLPGLLAQYPTSHQYLLDGAPVVRDVVWDRQQSDLGDATKWHTMLVSGFGKNIGYYAMDVTQPQITQGGAGPQFRWQLTRVPGQTKQVFGATAGTPAITTVYATLNDGKSTSPREIGVAILPGGLDAASTGASCARDTDTHDAPLSTASTASPLTSWTARTNVRCWGGNGRSVSIVRLDTGDIIRTFMRYADAPTGIPLTPTPLDSPMTGIPVVYPTTVGEVAKKFFIGDADGTVWRFDLSSTDPSQWKGELFFDMYNQSMPHHASNDGQPISVPPVISLDSAGNLVLHVATGDQENFTASGYNYVASLNENLTVETPTSHLRATPNWYYKFANPGERVTGPMAVFDSVLYLADYDPGATTTVCRPGAAYIYGMDFRVPPINDTVTSGTGGLRRLLPTGFTTPPDRWDLVANGVVDAGSIVPGVTINIAPTCSDTSQTLSDPYVPGPVQHYVANNVTPTKPSLTFEGVKSGATSDISTTLPPPQTPTTIDSWAAVVE